LALIAHCIRCILIKVLIIIIKIIIIIIFIIIIIVYLVPFLFTIYFIIVSILDHILFRMCRYKVVNFCLFNRHVIDARMKQLHCAGIGATQKQAAPITPRKEEKLWESGQLGAHSAKSLLNPLMKQRSV
jgi:hypothetical protein